jgi:hypothetical protein
MTNFMDSLVDMTNSSMEGRTREKLDEDEISYARRGRVEKPYPCREPNLQHTEPDHVRNRVTIIRR